jgi:phospholipid/cholesterol/gamma-HCH transport system ATP-binding protein
MPEFAGETILRFEDVTLHYDETPALEHVSFEVRKGETRIVMGAAGSGKTTLLKAAIGLVRPDSGRIWLFGQEINRLGEQELVDLRARVGMLFQEGGLFDSLTIEENVAYPLLYQRGRRPKPEDVRERVVEALTFVELEHTLDKFPSELSGGMRRRVGIARANVTNPPLVLYDSPTAGLDPITANTIVALIMKERDVNRTTSIVVTQRYQDGQMLANYYYDIGSGTIRAAPPAGSGNGSRTVFMVMREGRLVFEGFQKELEASTDPYLSKFVRR